MNSKIKSFAQIKKISQTLHVRRKQIVFTNGCFDILHAGHVSYLERAKKMGDVLIVGLNRDRSVRKIKGPKRPINSEQARAHVLSALEAVDFVVPFGEETPLRLINHVKPNILVKGGDWPLTKIVGYQEVKSWNGTVKRIPFLKGCSTTSILHKLGE